MKLYSTFGVSPLSELRAHAADTAPILFAMFQFFYNAIRCGGKSFLWARFEAATRRVCEAALFSLLVVFWRPHYSMFTLL
jgi:YidC/Oxa1 family membrane protein insertase